MNHSHESCLYSTPTKKNFIALGFISQVQVYQSMIVIPYDSHPKL